MVDWFIPGYKAGGPIQSCLNIAKALQNKFDVYVITSDRDHGEVIPYKNIEPNRWNTEVLPGVKVYYVKKGSLNRTSLADLINEIDPQIIYLNQLFSPFFVMIPLWLKWKNKIKGKVILCPRGVLHNSALAQKSYKKKPFLFLLKLIKLDNWIYLHATNEEEAVNIKKVFKNSKIFIANNLPDIDQDCLKIIDKKIGELNCVTISRIVPIKNLMYFIDILKDVKSKVNYFIAGPIEDKVYWDACLQKIKLLPANIKVNYLGSIEKSEVKRLIEENHLFVLPTIGENFGHAIFESFLSGRPVLISNKTPWINLEENDLGWDINLANPLKFIEAVVTAANWNQETFNEKSEKSWNYAKSFINNKSIISDYEKMFS